MNSLFDLPQGQELKEDGMQSAADKRKELLDTARHVAGQFAILNRQRECTADDVQRILIDEMGYHENDLGPAAGSVFRGNQWEFTGKWIASTRISRHASMIRVWRLK